jgi:SNF2 family DNA or RNA helicase
VKGTIEERILELQERKKKLASGALGDNPDGLVGKLNIRDLVGLFGRVTGSGANMRVE